MGTSNRMNEVKWNVNTVWSWRASVYSACHIYHLKSLQFTAFFHKNMFVQAPGLMSFPVCFSLVSPLMSVCVCSPAEAWCSSGLLAHLLPICHQTQYKNSGSPPTPHQIVPHALRYHTLDLLACWNRVIPGVSSWFLFSCVFCVLQYSPGLLPPLPCHTTPAPPPSVSFLPSPFPWHYLPVSITPSSLSLTCTLPVRLCHPSLRPLKSHHTRHKLS